MQLLVAVVQSVDADPLIQGLMAQGIRATRIDSVGSFLAQGNVTVLMGVEETQVKQALEVLAATCRTRRSYVSTMTPGLPDAPHISSGVLVPLEVEVGGAVVFSLPVELFLNLSQTLPATSANTTDTRPSTAVDAATSGQGASHMKLVVAILQDDDADRTSDALLGAGYRLTRLKTTGGFFRRGNATLLIGVEAERVDAAIETIRANSRPARADAKPGPTGTQPGVTVFVLDVTQVFNL